MERPAFTLTKSTLLQDSEDQRGPAARKHTLSHLHRLAAKQCVSYNWHSANIMLCKAGRQWPERDARSALVIHAVLGVTQVVTIGPQTTLLLGFCSCCPCNRKKENRFTGFARNPSPQTQPRDPSCRVSALCCSAKSANVRFLKSATDSDGSIVHRPRFEMRPPACSFSTSAVDIRQ